jgi:hypothetical protein
MIRYVARDVSLKYIFSVFLLFIKFFEIVS